MARGLRRPPKFVLPLLARLGSEATYEMTRTVTRAETRARDEVELSDFRKDRACTLHYLGRIRRSGRKNSNVHLELVAPEPLLELEVRYRLSS